MSPLPSGTRFPIQVISTIKPAGSAQFPVVSDVDIEGGYQVRASLTDRDNIPTTNRKTGMLVYVQADDKFYTLTGGTGNANWVEKDFGGGGGGTLAGDVTGPAGSNLVTSINGVALDTVTAPTNGGALHYVQEADNALFPHPQAIITDGTHVWVANYQSKLLTKTTLSTRVSVNIDLSAYLPGGASAFIRSMKKHSSYPNYIFMGGMDSGRVLIYDKTTDTVVGVGSISPTRARCVTVDNHGNLWVGNHSGNNRMYRFVIATMLSSFPTVVSANNLVSCTPVEFEQIESDGDFVWGASSDGDLNKIDVLAAGGNGAEVGNYNNAGWNTDLIIDSGFVWVLDQSSEQIQKYDPSSFDDGPLTSVTLTNISYLVTFCLKGGFFWVPDNSSGSGPNQNNLVKVQQNPLVQTAFYDRPGTEDYWHSIAADPISNRVYVTVFEDETASNLGFRVFNTGTNTWVDSFTRLGPPILKYCPASCTNTNRPLNPFIGQMVFVIDLDSPNPIALWWNGTNWIDDQGITR
jgi:hypothetical protein